MNTTNSQKGSVKGLAAVIVLVIIIIIIVFVGAHGYYLKSTQCPSWGCSGSPGQSIATASLKGSAIGQMIATASSTVSSSVMQVTIMVPNDLAAYEKAMNAFTQVSGGTDPSKTFPFVVQTVTVPQSADVVRASAEAAAEVIPTQAGTTSLVVYLKVVNGTAYVLLNMDLNGWAGVSVAIANVHPLVEKTLLNIPGINAVKFGPAPGDTISTSYPNTCDTMGCLPGVQQGPNGSTSNWKTYTNNQYGLFVKYPTTLGNATISTPQIFATTTSSNIDSNGCYQSGLASGAGATGLQIIVNGIQFCQTNDLNPGAGMLSGDYYFTTHKNGEYITIGYPTFTSNGCGAAEGTPNYASCEDFENNYKTIVIQPLQQSAGTLTFTN